MYHRTRRAPIPPANAIATITLRLVILRGLGVGRRPLYRRENRLAALVDAPDGFQHPVQSGELALADEDKPSVGANTERHRLDAGRGVREETLVLHVRGGPLERRQLLLAPPQVRSERVPRRVGRSRGDPGRPEAPGNLFLW